MSRQSADRVPACAREVLRYFLRNPRAADDAEGVARWRLQQASRRRGVQEVEAALTWLVEQEFLVERSTIGRAPVFSLNAERVSRAERFLAAGDGRSSKRDDT